MREAPPACHPDLQHRWPNLGPRSALPGQCRDHEPSIIRPGVPFPRFWDRHLRTPPPPARSHHRRIDHSFLASSRPCCWHRQGRAEFVLPATLDGDAGLRCGGMIAIPELTLRFIATTGGTSGPPSKANVRGPRSPHSRGGGTRPQRPEAGRGTSPARKARLGSSSRWSRPAPGQGLQAHHGAAQRPGLKVHGVHIHLTFSLPSDHDAPPIRARHTVAAGAPPQRVGHLRPRMASGLPQSMESRALEDQAYGAVLTGRNPTFEERSTGWLAKRYAARAE